MDFINKLTGHDDDADKKPEPIEPTVAAPAPEPERHHKLFGSGEDEEKKHEERPPVEPTTSKRSSFIDKLTGRHDEEPEPVVAKPPPVPAKEQSFLGKLKDRLDGDDEPPVVAARPPTPPPKEESLGDKIGKFFGHKEPEKTLEEREAELRLREEELKRREDVLKRQKEAEEHPHLTQIMEGLNLREKTPEPEKKEQGLGAKINAALGGGHAAEAEEDHLDKAIDFVQEHILKKGDQSHESFVEQMKDDQIASFVRKQYKERTGHEFPLKEVKKE